MSLNYRRILYFKQLKYFEIESTYLLKLFKQLFLFESMFFVSLKFFNNVFQEWTWHNLNF